jgi:hypothetical protein
LSKDRSPAKSSSLLLLLLLLRLPLLVAGVLLPSSLVVALAGSPLPGAARCQLVCSSA